MCLMLLYYVFCFNIIKMVTKMGPLNFYCIFLHMVFVLACLRMTSVKAETCRKHRKVTNRINIKLCSVRLNGCGLFSNIYNGMVSIKVAQ
jgi:hypothetical protein